MSALGVTSTAAEKPMAADRIAMESFMVELVMP